MLSKGLVLNNTYQEFDGLCAMYPADYFCPKDHRTGEIKLSKNTVCIHHFAGSWLEHKSTEYKLYKLKIKLMQIFGVQRINKLISILHLKSIKNRLFK
jgi:hypothetical protein